MTTVPLLQIDAFTDRPFAGNPAAVALLRADDAVDDAWMLRVAAEMNLSETAFVWPRADGSWTLRWCTPTTEVDLCGHATLATAHALATTGRAALGERQQFHTRSGILHAVATAEGVTLDFPALPITDAPVPDAVAALIDAPVIAFGTNAIRYALSVVEDAGAVRAYTPDVAALAALPYDLLILTAPGDDAGIDCVSRCFGPNVGVDEDPVTGSAHCTIGPYWATRLGRDELTAYQASPRGGTLRLRIAGDRVHLTGHAVTVLNGELTA